MHGPNRLNDALLISPRALAQVAVVGHGTILREASSASSLKRQMLKQVKAKLKN